MQDTRKNFARSAGKALAGDRKQAMNYRNTANEGSIERFTTRR